MIIHLISFVQVLSSGTKLICWIVLMQLKLCRRRPCLVRAEILSHDDGDDDDLHYGYYGVQFYFPAVFF